MKKVLRILIVDDSEADVLLLAQELARSGYELTSLRTDTAAGLTEALAQGGWDVVLIDYRMPQLDAVAAISIVRSHNPDIPCIVISGVAGEERVVETLKVGATDYIMKDNIRRFLPAVERSFQEALLRRHVRIGQENLFEKEERYRALLENLDVGVFRSRVSAGGEWLSASVACARIFGYESADDFCKAAPALACQDPEDRKKILDSIKNDGFIKNYELKAQKKDGSPLWVSLSGRAKCTARGEIEWIDGIIENMNERKRAESALREAKEYLAAIINAISDPVFVKDRQHRLVLVNDAECALAGKPRHEMIGKNDYDFFPKEQVDIFWANDDEVFNTGKENINEEEITDVAGRLRTIVTKKTLYVDPRGDAFIVGIIRDVTDRKAAEDALRFAYERMQELQNQLVQSAKIASIGMLAGQIAHEINNPLTGVLNNLELMRLKSQQNQRCTVSAFAEELASIEEGARRCSAIIKALLEFSRSSKGKFTKVSLNELIEKVAIIAEQELKRAGILLARNLKEQVPFVLGDTQLLMQVVTGIVANAKWAIIHNEPSREKCITIATFVEPETNAICMSIADTGIGMTAEQQEKIFESFYTMKVSGEGTGLGLSIASSIVEAHSGNIRVESKPQEGTTFYISFPAIRT
ncbi:MAG: PAS domain S-box protein [Candidatus Omnitrophota bacterium]